MVNIHWQEKLAFGELVCFLENPSLLFLVMGDSPLSWSLPGPERTLSLGLAAPGCISYAPAPVTSIKKNKKTKTVPAAGHPGTQRGPCGSSSFPKRSPQLEHPALPLSLCNTHLKSLYAFSTQSIFPQEGRGRMQSLPKGN